jgi:hypothetical protein
MNGRKRTLEEMIGESLREMEALVTVFYGLSTFIELGGVSPKRIVGGAMAFLIGLALWLIGAQEELAG